MSIEEQMLNLSIDLTPRQRVPMADDQDMSILLTQRQGEAMRKESKEDKK
jgi:hypothetical protein